MAEPPAKRARRTDSTAMWDEDEGALSQKSRPGNPGIGAHDGRRRSRSRDKNRPERRHERSRSRDRYRDRDRDRERDRDRKDREGRNGYDRRDRDRRDKERSRSRDRKRDVPAKFGRDRSRSPTRNGTGARTRSPPRGPRADRTRHEDEEVRGRPKREERNGDAMHLDEPNALEDEDPDALLRRTMGFTSFNTTNNKKVPGNDVYGVRKEKRTQYRQYMNRTGGFNRPLSPSRS